MAREAGSPGRPYFTPRLMQQIQAFFEEHPDMGELDLTDFAQEAARFYLDYLRKQKMRQDIIRLAAQNKLSNDAVRRLFPPED